MKSQVVSGKDTNKIYICLLKVIYKITKVAASGLGQECYENDISKDSNSCIKCKYQCIVNNKLHKNKQQSNENQDKAECDMLRK